MEKKKERKGNNEELVVDSSVVVKWFLNEQDSDIALVIRNEFATNQLKLIVPTLIFYEVMNALRFSRRFGEEDLAVASRSLSRYQFEVWRPIGVLLELSAKLSVKKNLSLYDACYVALADRKRAKLITEDREILEKFPDTGYPLSSFHKVNPAIGSFEN